MKNKHAKRLAALILCAVLCLTAVACGKQDSGNDGSSSSSSEASAQETVEAGNTAKPTKNEADVAQEEESAVPQQTAAPKTEHQTSAKKKMTQVDVDELNRQIPYKSSFANSGVELKFSLRGNSLVLSMIAIPSGKTDDDKLASVFNATESFVGSFTYTLEEYDIDSFIYEAVNKDGKIICSKEYK